MDSKTKSSNGKPAFHLIPAKPFIETAKAMGHGEGKHGARNYQYTPDRMQYFRAAIGHLFAWKSGETMDSESGLNSLAHAIASILILHELVGDANATEIDKTADHSDN